MSLPEGPSPRSLANFCVQARYCPGPSKLRNLIAIAIANVRLEGKVRIAIAIAIARVKLKVRVKIAIAIFWWATWLEL